MDIATLKLHIKSRVETMARECNDVRGGEVILETVDRLTHELKWLIMHLYCANHDIHDTHCSACHSAREIAQETMSR